MDIRHHHGVLAGDHSVDADAEEHRAQQKELVQQHGQSFLASTMAPITAASRTNDSAQNGKQERLEDAVTELCGGNL
jgi:hypothetical protein